MAVGCASNSVGSINPVAEIRRWAREVGALSFLDAVHFAPNSPKSSAQRFVRAVCLTEAGVEDRPAHLSMSKKFNASWKEMPNKAWAFWGAPLEYLLVNFSFRRRSAVSPAPTDPETKAGMI